jgi:hypothetical protein
MWFHHYGYGDTAYAASPPPPPPAIHIHCGALPSTSVTNGFRSVVSPSPFTTTAPLLSRSFGLTQFLSTMSRVGAIQTAHAHSHCSRSAQITALIASDGKGCGGEDAKIRVFTSALFAVEQSDSHSSRFILGAHWIGGWVGLRAGCTMTKKNCLPSRDSVIQPLASRYKD